MTERDLDMTPEVLTASALKRAQRQARASATGSTAADPLSGSATGVPHSPSMELHGSGGGDGAHTPPHPGGGNGNGGWGKFFKMKDIPTPVKLVFALLLGLGWLLVQDYFEERRLERDSRSQVRSAENKKMVSEIEKGLKVSSAPVVPPAAKQEAVYASVFSCSTLEMKNQGFETEKTQVFTSDVKFLSGCAAAKFDFDVTNIEGKNFLIEFPDTNDLSKTFKCDTPEACINFVNYLRDGKKGDPRIWVVVKDGGYVTLRR